MDFGEKLRMLRKEKELSQEELADLVEVKAYPNGKAGKLSRSG